MDMHKNARLTPLGRERLAKMVLGGQTPQAASEAVGVCPGTARKWVDRFNKDGPAGLQDRSSRPHRLRQPTPQPLIERIESLRRQRMPGKEIAAQVGVSTATVSRVLKRLGLNKLSALEPAEPPRRYERERPGEMIHIDIKKLGKFNQIGHRITGDRKGQSNSRGVGWEFVHVCIDDASRVAFSRIMKSERKGCAVAFLKAAVAYYPLCQTQFDRDVAVPLLILIGDKDDWTPADRCRQLQAAGFARPDLVQAIYYPNAYHSFDSRSPDRSVPGNGSTMHRLAYDPAAAPDAESRTKAFLDKYLR